jgi:hypothetical protein
MNIDTNKAAALSLLERAYRALTQGQLDTLLGSAKRLDPSLDTQAIELQWLARWQAAQAKVRLTLT